jgi:hypothetical protein
VRVEIMLVRVVITFVPVKFFNYQGRLAIVASVTRLFFENAWHFKDIFRAFEAFLKISILFEDISIEIEAFFN